jgi:hypothetical protein
MKDCILAVGNMGLECSECTGRVRWLDAVSGLELDGIVTNSVDECEEILPTQQRCEWRSIAAALAQAMVS